MHITAVAIGSYGDVEPFIVLGKELAKRGHGFNIATFCDFKAEIVKKGLGYYSIDGSLDKMMRILLSDSDNSKSSGINGIRNLLSESKNLYRNLDNACRNADVVMYMQFGALAYHFAEKYKIPCIRTFVFPSDPTKQFSAMMADIPDNTFKCKLSYWISDFFMNSASLDTANEFRKNLRLNRWHKFSSYKKMNGKKILTLYQFSPFIVPRDRKWGKHIILTGAWEADPPKGFKPEQRIVDFLEAGARPLYIGFGSMIYSKAEALGDVIYKTLQKSNKRAILSSELNPRGKYKSGDKILYVDFVPFDWLFPQVCGVIHHGGCGTVHIGLKYGKPTFVIAFGADQMFWGKRIAKLNCGPDPVDIKADFIDEELLSKKINELCDSHYETNAKVVSAKLIKENGRKKATSIIEKYFEKNSKYL